MFALYIHWPFCLSRCPYCDFNAHVRDSIPDARYEKALLAEMAHYASLTKGRTIDSIFFGGGTPSLMPPAMAGRLLEAANQNWGFSPNIEITLEANPSSVENARLKDFRAAGVNRLSLGVQSLREDQLKFLGRRHDKSQALDAIKMAAAIFPRYSFDLIYARPGQTPADWKAELTEALPLMRDHLSLYQLTIEPNTAFENQYRRGDFKLPDDDTAGELYELTEEILNQHNMSSYEISNYAKPGQESRHNMVYWRYSDYAGIGCGAHGRLTLDGVKHATKQWRAPETWMDKVENSGHGTELMDKLDAQTRGEEMLMMGLRLAEGIAFDRFYNETQINLLDFIESSRVQFLQDEGFIEITPTHITATFKGRQCLNSVLGELLKDS